MGVHFGWWLTAMVVFFDTSLLLVVDTTKLPSSGDDPVKYSFLKQTDLNTGYTMIFSSFAVCRLRMISYKVFKRPPMLITKSLEIMSTTATQGSSRTFSHSWIMWRYLLSTDSRIMMYNWVGTVTRRLYLDSSTLYKDFRWSHPTCI